jgi:ribosome-binding factor A
MKAGRIARVNELFKREMGNILQREGEKFKLGFITVTDVEVSKDLRHARVFVTVYGDEVERERCLKKLRRAAGYLRTEIGKKVRLRYLPAVEFVWDESIERGAHILDLLEKIKNTEED